ncbi:MAG: hypothetical protein ABIH86_06175 [Planctomycetota bacterium]
MTNDSKDANEKKNVNALSNNTEIIIEDGDSIPDAPPPPAPKPEPKPATPPSPPPVSLGGVYGWLIALTLAVGGAYAVAHLWRTDAAKLKSDWTADIATAIKGVPSGNGLTDADKQAMIQEIVKTLQSRLDALGKIEASLADINARTAANDSSVKTLTDKVSALDSLKAELATIAALNESLARLTALEEDQKKQWTQMEASTTAAIAAGDTTALADELRKLSESIKTLTTDLTSVKTEASTLKQTDETLKADDLKQTETVAELDKTHREIFMLKTELDAFRETVRSDYQNRLTKQQGDISILETRVKQMEAALDSIKPIRIIEPLDGLVTDERFKVIEAVLIKPELITSVKAGRVVITSQASGTTRTTPVEFINGKTKTTQLLVSGGNVISVEVESEGQTYADKVTVTSTAEPSQMRVILNWIGNSDLDLMVKDSTFTGRREDQNKGWCFYNNKTLASGATLDRDDRRDYLPGSRREYREPPGPETFLLSKKEGHTLVPGVYQIEVYGFQMRDIDGNNVASVNPPVEANVTVILHEDDPARTEVLEYKVQISGTRLTTGVSKVTLTE